MYAQRLNQCRVLLLPSLKTSCMHAHYFHSMCSHVCAASQDHHCVTHLTHSAALFMRRMHITGTYLDAHMQAVHEESAKLCGVEITPSSNFRLVVRKLILTTDLNQHVWLSSISQVTKFKKDTRDTWGPCLSKVHRRAMTCRVLPRPISSASTAPYLHTHNARSSNLLMQSQTGYEPYHRPANFSQYHSTMIVQL